MANTGLLIVRLVVGLTLMGHGTQKLFGWFGGGGPQKTGKGFEDMGLKPGVFMAVLGGLAELIGGLLFAAGFLTILGAIIIIVTMLVAIFTAHIKNGYWAGNNGFEYNLVLITIAVGIALAGPGSYSFDSLIF